MKNFLCGRRILRTIAFLFSIFFISGLSAQVQTPRYISMIANSHGFYEYLPQGYSSGSQTYPVLLFLHGSGETGNGVSDLPKMVGTGLPSLIQQGKFPVSFTSSTGATNKFIVISPQFVVWPTFTDVDSILNYIIKNYRVDINRLYITGLSMGGGVTWEYVGNNATYARRIAAIVPICGASYPDITRANTIADNGVAVWATHNDGDPTAPVYYTNDYIAEILARNPNAPAKKTIFHSNSHDAWTATYDPGFSENGMNIYQWMLQYSRGTTVPANLPPKSNAGADVSLTLPTNSVQLNGNGSSDPDGSIASYSWTKTSGPTQFTISNANIVNPVFSNLIAGIYTLRLTVTDNKGATATDDITITVNNSVSYTSVPGKIEAEKYSAMFGIQTESCTDAGAGLDVGDIDPNDWMDYSINPTAAGNYTVSFRIASVSPSKLQVKKSDGTVLATVSFPSTGGYQTWSTATATFALTAGNQVIRVLANTEGWNINWIQFAAAGSTTPVSPPVTTPPVTPPPTSTSKYIDVNVYGGTNPYSNSSWNNWNVGTQEAYNIASGTLKYADGTTSTLSAILSYSETVVDNGTSYSGSMAPAEVLRYTSYSTGNRTLTINGLSSSKKYNMEFYASRGANAGNSTIFNINGVSQSVSSYNNVTQKASFTNLTPDTQGKILVNISQGTTYNYINGFMITENAGTTTSSLPFNSSSTAETIDSTGIHESALIYPNPASDHITLQLNNSYRGKVYIEIIDISGTVKKKLVINKDQNNLLQNLPVGNEFSAGNYYVRIIMGSQSRTLKLMKL